MERTLKEVQALKQAQSIAEGLGSRDNAQLLAQIGIVWGLIAVHEVLDRITDVLDQLPLEAAADRVGLAIKDPHG